MSRYLTPSKIGLLALISLYSDDVVPSIAMIPVLSFLISHLLPVDPSAEQDRPFIISIECFQKATITHSSCIPGRTLWDLLLKKLWEVTSFDALHVFFDSLSLLLVKTGDESSNDAGDEISTDRKRILLSRTSPLGAFVRRAQLEFTRLQFHDGVTLWKSYITYRGPTMSMWKRRNPAAKRIGIDENLQADSLSLGDQLTGIVYGDFADENRKEASVSTEDVEKLLEYQVDQMQRMGNRLPEAMKTQFRKMVRTGVTVPSLSHYVRFLDTWKAGDYPSSFDNLHRYFDYTMHNRDRTFYQYALLNLAILQADFGCFAEAIVAMQETISTARENNDMGCLNYSLSWLYHFGKTHPEELGEVQKKGVLGTEKEALAFLKAKAKESSMWSLLSTSLLSEARLALCNGDSTAFAFESIMKASHLNVTKNVANAVGSQMMMQSSIFSRLGRARQAVVKDELDIGAKKRIGVNCQAWSCGEHFLQCYAAQSPIEDVIHCICKSAYSLAQRGRYNDALSRMDEINQEALRTLKDNLVAAEHVLFQIRAAPDLGQDWSFAVVVLEIDLHVRRKDFSTALTMLEKLSTRLSNEEADIEQRIQLMTLKARILDKAGTPQKGFSVALRAASLAYRAMLLPTLWKAVGALCRVLISLREFSAAAKLLESIMPQVLECENCDLSAHTFSFLADAHMGMAGQARVEAPQRKEQMVKALEYIGRSFDDFSRIEDIKGQCEMMAKKATIMHLNGDLILANDCASKYLDIKRAAKEES
ncbi:Anaphase-promoting complex subunit 5 [Toensbergia leucococca]|nr:Anaphase-promoting complex subunit 5 [Toensbergia leucococca]